MSVRGYGYYPEEGGLYTAGLLTGGGRTYKAGFLTGGGLRSFREGKTRYPSLAWGIKKLINTERAKKIKEKQEEKERKGEKTWSFYFNEYVIPAIERAKAEYKRSLSEPERKAYEKREQERKRKKQLEKENIEKIKNVFEKELKDKQSKTKTCDNIAEALVIEGNPDNRILRKALTYLYPELKTKKSKRTGKPVLNSVKITVDEPLPKKEQGSFLRLLEEIKEETREQAPELVEETDEEGYETAEEEEVKEPKEKTEQKEQLPGANIGPKRTRKKKEQLQGAGIRVRKTRKKKEQLQGAGIRVRPKIRVKGLEELED